MNETEIHPDDMPIEDFNSPQRCRSLLFHMEIYESVEIHWEKDVEATEATGEEHGTWSVAIDREYVEGTNLVKLLWAAQKRASLAKAGRRTEFEKKRKAALSKLSDEDKRVLGFC